jgi:hypothetical protein
MDHIVCPIEIKSDDSCDGKSRPDGPEIQLPLHPRKVDSERTTRHFGFVRKGDRVVN